MFKDEVIEMLKFNEIEMCLLYDIYENCGENTAHKMYEHMLNKKVETLNKKLREEEGWTL